MLSTQQQQLIQSIEQRDAAQVRTLLEQGIDPNFIDAEKGPPISVLCDALFGWWEEVCEAYEQQQPLNEQQKQHSLQVYLEILEALIAAKANLHLWDSEELYGPLWDAVSAACVPVVQRLLAEQVDPNTLDEQNMPILSSISYLWFECDFDEIDWQKVLVEERATLMLLREHGAKMVKEM